MCISLRFYYNIIAVLIVFNATSSIIMIKGVEISSAFEQDCIKPHPSVARNIDYEWMLSVPRWYIPLQSRLNLVRYSETLLQTRASNITQEQLDDSNSCLSFKWDTPPVLYGFGGKAVTYTTTNVFQNTYGYNTRWDGDIRGRHYLTLRDNKSFVFFTTCWGDGKASWSVISTKPSLDEEITTEIFEHAKSLGFQEEFFLQQNYESCPKLESNGDGDGDKNEL